MISDLTTEVNGLAESGKPDLKLDNSTVVAYLNALKAFHDALQGRLDTINGLEGIGDPGRLGSAIQTKLNLQRQGNAFKYSIMEYMDYIDALAGAVAQSGNRMIAEG